MFRQFQYPGDKSGGCLRGVQKRKTLEKDYRHYNIKSVTGPDDYASMREIVERRYARLLNEGSPLPQLIVIDGGKGQLHAAVESLQKIGLYGKIAVIGIAKRLEEIYYPGDSVPLYIDKNAETLKLIQQLRDEAHRFGITFHRQKESKSQLVSELDGVKGIGPETKKKLLTHFKSIKRIKEANEDEIVALIGKIKVPLSCDGSRKGKLRNEQSGFNFQDYAIINTTCIGSICHHRQRNQEQHQERSLVAVRD